MRQLARRQPCFDADVEDERANTKLASMCDHLLKADAREQGSSSRVEFSKAVAT